MNQNQGITVDKNMNIVLTPQHLSVVMNALQAGQFKVVAPVIASIDDQCRQQMIAPAQPASEDGGEETRTGDRGNSNI